jgi:hypothetical protein
MESRLMIEAPPDLAGAVADTVALMQLEGRVVLPMGSKDQRMHRTREQVFEGCRSEVTEAIAALRRGEVKLHGLHPGRLDEGRKLSDALRSILGAPPVMKDDSPLPDDDALGGYMAKCLPEAAFTMRLRAQTPLWTETMKPWGNGEVEVSVAPYEPYHDITEYVGGRGQERQGDGLVYAAVCVADVGCGGRRRLGDQPPGGSARGQRDAHRGDDGADVSGRGARTWSQGA